MSVIMTNMDMPNSCSECQLKTRCEYALANGWLNNKRDDNCPLKPYEERKNGKWINTVYLYRCSECNAVCPIYGGEKTKTPYCPRCGAKMEGADNE